MGKARSLPKEWSTLKMLHSGLTKKHYTRLERLRRDKHSSLSRTSINYSCKKFEAMTPDLVRRNIRIVSAENKIKYLNLF